MLTSLDFKQKLGQFFNGGCLLFSNSGKELFSSAGTAVLRVNIEENWNRELPLRANGKVEVMQICKKDSLFLFADSLFYLFLYNLSSFLLHIQHTI